MDKIDLGVKTRLSTYYNDNDSFSKSLEQKSTGYIFCQQFDDEGPLVSSAISFLKQL